MPGAQTTALEARESAPGVQLAHVLSDDEIRRTWRTASALAKSSMFKDARQAEQAFAKILIGRDLGMTAAQAMQGLHVYEGRVEVAAPMLGNFIRSRDGYDYEVDWLDGDKPEEQGCKVTIYHPGRDGQTRADVSQFTMADAATAKLGEKDTYKKYPRNMTFSRAMSNGVKWFVPEVLAGIPVYFPGEVPAGEDLTAGAGDGAAEGIDLGPAVEGVLARAETLGHGGLSDRAAAEMRLGGREPQVTDEWVKWAHAELDKVDPERQGGAEEEKHDGEPEEKPDPGNGAPESEAAEEVSPDQVDGKPYVEPTMDPLEHRLEEVLAAQRRASEEGDAEVVAELEAEAESIRAELKAKGDDAQQTL